MIHEVHPGPDAISKACATAQPGDVIAVYPGIYPDLVKIRCSGTEAAHITIEPFSGDRPIIDGATTPADSTLVNISGKYVDFHGFEVANSQKTGIGIFNTHHVKVMNNEIHHSLYGGIRAYADNPAGIWDVDVTDNGVHDNCLMNKDRILSSGWPFAIGCRFGARIQFARNNVYGNYGEGIGIGLSDSCSVSGNLSYDNFSCLIYLNASKNCEVTGNTGWCVDPAFYRDGKPSTGLAFADEVAGAGQSGHKIVSNMFAYCRRGINAQWMSAGLRDCIIRRNDLRYSVEEAIALGPGDYTGTIIELLSIVGTHTGLIKNESGVQIRKSRPLVVS